MIIGVGVDSIEIARVAAALQRSPRLRDRLFSPDEIEQLPGGAKAASRLAALFAAKEAVFKALGTGLAGHSWQDVQVLHRENGAPYICLRGQAFQPAKKRGIVNMHISLSHDQERALAFCLAEGVEA